MVTELSQALKIQIQANNEDFILRVALRGKGKFLRQKHRC